MNLKSFLISLLISLALLTSSAFGEESSNSTKFKVLILPFTIYSQQDYGYLKDAIAQMLCSRLFSPSKIEIIDLDEIKNELKNYSKINSSIAKTLAQKFKADYVIWGSVTILGKRASIDAQIMNVKKNKKPARFFQEIKDISNLIPQISRFAWKAKMYIEGKEKEFYNAEPFYASTPYTLDKLHPEREFFYYAPYLYPPASYERKPKVTKAKPAFGDTLEEGLSKNLVIDLSKGTIGWAEDEENKKTKKSQNKNATPEQPPYPAIYPPQPYYSYSPPPYYQEKEKEKESFLSKIWPFGKKERKKAYQTQVIPVYNATVPSPKTSSLPKSPSKNIQEKVNKSSNPWSWD